LLPLTRSLHFISITATATPALYPLSLHDALPISPAPRRRARDGGDRPWRARRSRQGAAVDRRAGRRRRAGAGRPRRPARAPARRSEEHTSELQSRGHLVCRLLLEKKK